MAITRSLQNQFNVTDWTPELLVIPNTFGVINEANLFIEDGITQNAFVFEEITQASGTVVDRVRGERNNQNSDRTRKLRTFPVPHFPLDDYITPADIQGQRAYGSPDQADTLAAVRTRKLEDIALKHNMTKEIARAQLLTAGTFYAPTGTVDNTTTIWTEFGVTRKQVDFTWGTGGTDPMIALEQVTAHILDNAQGENIMAIRCFASPEFFTKLITVSNYQFKTAVFNYDTRHSGQTIGDLTIEANDRKLLVFPRDDVKPSAADWQVEIDSKWWSVLRVKSVSSRGVDVYLELHVRLADGS